MLEIIIGLAFLSLVGSAIFNIHGKYKPEPELIEAALIEPNNETTKFKNEFDQPVFINESEIVELSELDELHNFLLMDNTDEHEYKTDIYECGHFSRDLALNATKNDISVGAILLGKHKDFQGYNNHATNYIIIENEMYLISPQSDYLEKFIDSYSYQKYNYYKLYPDATQMPSKWRGKIQGGMEIIR